MEHGFFITFEGPEGAGKTTQIERLKCTLQEREYKVLVTREPGGTALGEQLRTLIKHTTGPEPVTPEAELLMIGASRAQLVRQVIEPHLAQGGIVLCDRFADSTTVYQGLARGLNLDFIQQLHAFTLCSRWPDLTLLLDLDVDLGLQRSRTRTPQNSPIDRIEAEPNAFHQRVRHGFLDLAHQCPQRIRVVNADETPEQVELRIREIVDRALG